MCPAKSKGERSKMVKWLMVKCQSVTSYERLHFSTFTKHGYNHSKINTPMALKK